MIVKELIEKLKTLPQDLPIRCLSFEATDDDENQWITNLEISETGTSGYEESGEVRLITNE
mgnify:CR=1 FL=1|tara:strand:- start:1985 stop:2167 length:183 start_codon:yes stop_codon:yes gene_type:complete